MTIDELIEDAENNVGIRLANSLLAIAKMMKEERERGETINV